jgi:TRAP-type C4-dicarboxylate transport system permease small subunit
VNGGSIRRLLDRLYDAAGALAALALVALLLIILAQILTRYLDTPFPGGTEYAGYCMAAASFLALAHTLRHAAHIRVELLAQHLPERARRLLEIVATAIAAGLGWYFAWFAARGVRVSRMIGDISQGQDATPLWIPQLVMAAGVLLLAVALTDHLVSIARGGPGIIAGERPAES